VTTTALRDQFPVLANNWHYLDTAASAQKPQVVLDAMMRAGGAGYAPSTAASMPARPMTVAFEAARERVAHSSAASPNSRVRARRDQGINLSHKLGPANLTAGDRMCSASWSIPACVADARGKGRRAYRRLPADRHGLIDLDWLKRT
jgi:cysteine desulfurase/selenocysteine lyase